MQALAGVYVSEIWSHPIGETRRLRSRRRCQVTVLRRFEPADSRPRAALGQATYLGNTYRCLLHSQCNIYVRLNSTRLSSPVLLYSIQRKTWVSHVSNKQQRNTLLCIIRDSLSLCLSVSVSLSLCLMSTTPPFHAVKRTWHVHIIMCYILKQFV